MKALLICPSIRPAVAALAKTKPLCAVPLLGKSLVEYWIEHLLQRGATDVRVLVNDRPEAIEAITGDGARWGLRVSVSAETRELTPAQVRLRLRLHRESGWLPEPNDVVLMDRLPGIKWRLFESYANWFAGLRALLPRAQTPDRIGMREVRPGIWVSVHARVSRRATLRAPCWIGPKAWIGPQCIIGPMAVIESGAWIERNCEVLHSYVGPETCLGKYLEARNSLAWGSTLINWQRGAWITVPDGFLMCPLGAPPVAAKKFNWADLWSALFGPERTPFPGAIPAASSDESRFGREQV